VPRNAHRSTSAKFHNDEHSVASATPSSSGVPTATAAASAAVFTTMPVTPTNPKRVNRRMRCHITGHRRASGAAIRDTGAGAAPGADSFTRTLISSPSGGLVEW
jgi:hypothetical protein